MLKVKSCDFIEYWARYLDFKFAWWNLFLSNLLLCVKLGWITIRLMMCVECRFDPYDFCEFLWKKVHEDDECWRTRWVRLNFVPRSRVDPSWPCLHAFSCLCAMPPITWCHVLIETERFNEKRAPFELAWGSIPRVSQNPMALHLFSSYSFHISPCLVSWFLFLSIFQKS